METKFRKGYKCKGLLRRACNIVVGRQILVGNSFETQHLIYNELCHTSSKITFALLNLYVMVQYLEKKECWQTLTNFLEVNSPKTIIAARDLNIVRDQMLPLVEDMIQ